MKPVLTLPVAPVDRPTDFKRSKDGRRTDGKIEVDVSAWRKRAKVAGEDVDERAARRALGVDEWRARRQRGGEA